MIFPVNSAYRALDYTPRHSKKPVKKSSILPPILSGKRSKSDDLWTKFAEGQAPSLPPNRIRSSDEEDFHNTDVTPTDVLSAAHALLPNQSPPPMALHDSSHSRPNNSKPYDHIDTPSRPVPNVSLHRFYFVQTEALTYASSEAS